MNTYSQDLDRIRDIVATSGNGHLDYFKALNQMQEFARQLAEEKFRLSMDIAMRDGKEFRPGWTARNSEEWEATEA